MKKLLALFLVFCLSVTISPVKAHAQTHGEFLRVITDDTPFYQSIEQSLPMFYLPYTYYVKVLGQLDDYLHVEVYSSSGWAGLDGFVPKHLLFDDQLTVEKPYLELKIQTAYTTVLYADQTLTNAIQYVFPQREMFYYGSITGDYGTIFCVGYNGKIGYVKEDGVLPFTIPNHPNQLTFLTPPEQPQQPQENITAEVSDFFGLKVIIVACLIFAGIIALFVALKQKNPKSNFSAYYDENDYE